MLRKDTEYIITQDWSPRLPTEQEIARQVLRYQRLFSGTVRGHQGRVALPNNTKKVLVSKQSTGKKVANTKK